MPYLTQLELEIFAARLLSVDAVLSDVVRRAPLSVQELLELDLQSTTTLNYNTETEIELSALRIHDGFLERGDFMVRGGIDAFLEACERGLRDKCFNKTPYVKREEWEGVEMMKEFDEILKIQTVVNFNEIVRPTSPFPFLNLPTEIRLLVYQRLLVGDLGYVEVCNEAQWFVRKRDPSFITPVLSAFTGILQSCKQVHDEATEVLYGDNTFVFRSEDIAGTPIGYLPMPLHYLEKTPERYRKLMKKVEVLIQRPLPQHSYPFKYPLLTAHRQWKDRDGNYPDIAAYLPAIQSLTYGFAWHFNSPTDISDECLFNIIKAHLSGGLKAAHVGWDFHLQTPRAEVAVEQLMGKGNFKTAKSLYWESERCTVPQDLRAT